MSIPRSVALPENWDSTRDSISGESEERLERMGTVIADGSGAG
jgi:hypothetical protein